MEASFLLREAGNNPDLKLDVIAPKFVKVHNKSTEARQFGPESKDFVFGSVEIGRCVRHGKRLQPGTTNR